MATDRLLFSQARQDGTASRARLSGTGQCDLLSHKDRLPVAQSAGALCPVGNGLLLFPIVEAQWALGGDSHSLSRTSARGGGTKSPPPVRGSSTARASEARSPATSEATTRARRS